MKQLRKFLALSFQHQMLICKALPLLSLLRIALWMMPFQQLNKLIQWLTTHRSQHEPSSVVSVSDVIWAIETATYYTPGNPKCFARALATRILLNHYGYDCELRIGVAKSDMNSLVAHAWIERQGQVLIGGDYNLATLTLLPSLD